MKRKERKMGLFIIGAFVGAALTILGLFLASMSSDEHDDGTYTLSGTITFVPREEEDEE